MGLDMYFVSIKTTHNKKNDIKKCMKKVNKFISPYFFAKQENNMAKTNSPEYYWRKHPNLHGWLFNKFKEQGKVISRGFHTNCTKYSIDGNQTIFSLNSDFTMGTPEQVLDKTGLLPVNIEHQSINEVPLLLDLKILSELEEVIKNNKLPTTKGGYYGISESTEEQKEYDLKGIEVAINEIKKGSKVYYFSWF